MIATAFTCVFAFAGMRVFGRDWTAVGGRLFNTSPIDMAIIVIFGAAGMVVGLVVTDWLFRKLKKLR